MGLSKDELTPTMQKAVDFIREHGSIVRYAGGYWNKPGCANYFEYSPGSFGTTTIDALAKRGVIEYTAWKEKTDSYRFPIAAKLKEAAS